MSTRKPSSLAVLKNLPAERQAEIFSRLTTRTADWPDTSYTAVRAWLKDDGFKTSESALSLFYSWYALQQRLQRNEATVETLLEEARKANPDISAAKIQEMGQAFFAALALSEQNASDWVSVQHLGLAERSAQFKAEIEKAKLELRKKAEARSEKKLQFEREKFEFDAAKAALKHVADLKVISTNSKLSEPEKVNLARQRLFGAVPAAT